MGTDPDDRDEDSLTPEELAELEALRAENRVEKLRMHRNLALKRLGIREYSAGEMKTYLRKKGATGTEADEIVRALIEEGLVDDKRYARVVARAQAHREKGPRYILSKLQRKGVKTDLREVKTMFGEVSDQSEVVLARKLIERRYPRAFEDQKEMQRAYQALLRRGFTRDVIAKCLKEDFGEDS